MYDDSLEVELDIKNNIIDSEINYPQEHLDGDVDTTIRVERDYNILLNIPKINGVELKGDKKASELNIKTSQLINDGDGKNPFVTTMSIKDLQKNIDNKIRTVNSVPSDMKAGDYIFLNEGEV